MSDDDGWSDDEPAAPARQVLGVYRVKKDFIPTSNDVLTLIQDDLVYVFSKEVAGKPGYWEGETKGVPGVFPSDHVEPNMTLDAELAAGKAKPLK
mmetsp:Transcript_27219/g.66057  ORF Transcript_27219/g.66057 Transcript_27219/m.66057 type:complete len:95 (+) Transcript_27219:68-352(+)